MAHASYARSGSTIFRFRRRRDRDAWVQAGPRSEARVALTASEVPLRLRTGRHVDGVELRDGPEPAEAPRARR